MRHSAQNFLFKLLAFEIENTQVMTLSVETVPMIKSQLISNSSERLGSPKAYVAIKYNFSLSKLYHLHQHQASAICPISIF